MYFPLEEQRTEYHLSNPYGPNDSCFFPYYDNLTSVDELNKFLFEEEYENNSNSSLINCEDEDEEKESKSFNSLFPHKET